MGSGKLRDLHKIIFTQVLNPRPSESRATSFPAMGSWGSFPREPRSSVWGRFKEANGATLASLLPSTERTGCFPAPLRGCGRTSVWLLQPHANPPTLSGARSGVLSPTSFSFREVPTIPPTRASRSEGLLATRWAPPRAKGSGKPALGSSRWRKSGGPRKWEKLLRRAVPGSGRLCGPLTLPQTFSSVAPTTSSRDTLGTGKTGWKGGGYGPICPTRCPKVPNPSFPAWHQR